MYISYHFQIKHIKRNAIFMPLLSIALWDVLPYVFSKAKQLHLGTKYVWQKLYQYIVKSY